MRFELFVATRYLRAKRRQAFIGVITAISILGVAAGVASLIVAAWWAGGGQSVPGHLYRNGRPLQEVSSSRCEDKEGELRRPAFPGGRLR